MATLRLDRLNVLILDDNRNMLRLLADIMRALGIRNVIQSVDPVDALREMRIAAVDVAFVDLEMSPLDGIEFVSLVRTAPDSPNHFLPIVMLTAHTQFAQVARARDAGVNEFLAKPVSPKTVYRRLASVIVNPRPFIRCKTYFGPDRRRRAMPYPGPERRAADPVVVRAPALSPAQVAALLEE